MAKTNLTLVLSTSTLFFAYLFLNLIPMIMSDDTCPYPCYPPPTGPGTPTLTTPPPPQSQSQSSLYPPPGYFPSPTGNLPNYPSPPFGNNFNAQPPPDPILPYFPYYYRKPPHQTEVSSATSLRRSSTAMITRAINVLAFTLLSGFLFM